MDTTLHRLAEQLGDGAYCPQAIRWVWIPNPGSRQRRPLGIPTIRDRVAQPETHPEAAGDDSLAYPPQQGAPGAGSATVADAARSVDQARGGAVIVKDGDTIFAVFTRLHPQTRAED